MFYEYETIKDLISWTPPTELGHTWAEHLLQILKKNNKGAPSGWFRNLLHPIGSKMGKRHLAPFEKEILIKLKNVFKLTGDGRYLLLSNMWGVTERTIHRIEDQSTMNALRQLSILPNTSLEEQTCESQKISGKRKESARTPVLQELDRCKKSTMHETPQNINKLKIYRDMDDSFPLWSITDHLDYAAADMIRHVDQVKDITMLGGYDINSNSETQKFQSKYAQTITENNNREREKEQKKKRRTKNMGEKLYTK
jgi:hypothetical protein